MQSNNGMILFDLDGTLCDTGLDLALSVNHALKSISLPEIDIELIKSYVGDGIHKLIERSLAHSDPSQFKRCLKIFLQYYNEHCIDNTILYSGTGDMLEELNKKYIMGVLTNKDRSFSEKILEGLGVLNYFSEIVGGDTLPVKKPDPEGIKYFSNKYAIPTERILMVGDHKTDIELSQRAGIISIYCNFGMGQTGDLIPNYRINSFNELPAILNRIWEN
jgi:phosphoglycolate phosphatase